MSWHYIRRCLNKLINSQLNRLDEDEKAFLKSKLIDEQELIKYKYENLPSHLGIVYEIQEWCRENGYAWKSEVPMELNYYAEALGIESDESADNELKYDRLPESVYKKESQAYREYIKSQYVRIRTEPKAFYELFNLLGIHWAVIINDGSYWSGPRLMWCGNRVIMLYGRCIEISIDPDYQWREREKELLFGNMNKIESLKEYYQAL